MHWLVLHLSFVWLSIVVIGGCIAAALLIALVCHIVLWRNRATEETNEELRQLFSVGAVLFSVIIGFLAVVAWERYLNVQQNVVSEAASVQAAYRESGLLDAPTGQPIRTGLARYAQLVVRDEWPELADGKSSPAVARQLDAVWTAADTVKSSSDGQITIGTSVAESLTAVTKGRQTRLYDSAVGLPWFFWTFVLAYAVFLVVMFNLFKNRRLGPQLGLNVILGLVIGAVCLFILLIDYPFAGDTAIRPAAFRQALQQMHEDAI
ncbi:MAG TPA: DUF4239 domain-containing protein [Candidatus Saccharimonadales bacterium]|nr:DUF4239 domain-containing protein [Candidatus Saccharimonadales bacterium]